MRRHAALAAALLLLGCVDPPEAPVVAHIPSRDSPRCAITDVVDGDTVRMRCGTGAEGSVRLVGFDTPETFRPGCAAEAALGQRAKEYLEVRLRRASVIRPEVKGKDKYQRTLVRLELDGRALEDIMVGAGLAKAYSGRTKRPDWCALLSG